MEEQQTQRLSRSFISETWLPFLTPGAIVLAGLMIAAAIFFTFSSPGALQQAQVVPSYSGQPSATLPGDLKDVAGNAGNVELKVNDDDHIRGNPSAPVTVVEFSDMQCPFCKRFHPTMKQALEEYGDKVRWVYKHFPLDAIHPEARPSAEASECVAEQKGNDGFWQFVDGVFENQERIGSALYSELAQQIGVNMTQFENCVNSRKYQQKVEDQYQEGIAAGVGGTPGNFVNGEPLPGAVPYDTLKAAIDRALSE